MRNIILGTYNIGSANKPTTDEDDDEVGDRTEVEFGVEFEVIGGGDSGDDGASTLELEVKLLLLLLLFFEVSMLIMRSFRGIMCVADTV